MGNALGFLLRSTADEVAIGLSRQLGLLSSLLGAKGCRKWLRSREASARRFAASARGRLRILQQRQRQLLLSEQHCVRIVHLPTKDNI